MEARDGRQMLCALNEFSKRTARRANESICGVRSSLLPAQPIISERWPSTMRSTRLRPALWASAGVVESPVMKSRRLICARTRLHRCRPIHPPQTIVNCSIGIPESDHLRELFNVDAHHYCPIELATTYGR